MNVPASTTPHQVPPQNEPTSQSTRAGGPAPEPRTGHPAPAGQEPQAPHHTAPQAPQRAQTLTAPPTAPPATPAAPAAPAAPATPPPAPPAAPPAPTAPPAASPTAPPAASPASPAASARDARVRRTADTRALTQVLFGELKRLERGTPEHARVRAALIEANLPLVRYAAARFRSRNEPMEDVVQVGTIGLINAIDRFDPDRGVQFPTFAMPTVVGEIKRYFRDNVRTVHVPRRLHELWVQVNGATEDLTTLHGRSPTTAEIAERLKISEEEVLSCIEAGRSYHATSLEAAQEGDGLPGLLDRLGYEDPALAGVEHRDLVRHLLVQLPEREQRILMLRYYRNLTQSQISQELGVSQMHVSRLLARSFARLRSANKIDA
ncbi:RNA polymerase sigma factor SigF [Streptomyces rubrolavendulae]|uniref:RNA polymerase sigma factor SigF n=1 Tax=Streptomyces rubrolavendulae TaxID=285473 RepID=A0A1D8G3G2_9ACTN|nr:RNA polymerase sigma factor SigF [Streptomyces rubrolavendulae]